MININEIQIKSGNEVTAEIIKEALDLDWETYKDEYHITIEQGRDYLEKNSYIYFVAVHNNKLVGYINFSPITKEMYEKIKSGNFIDTIIEKEDMLTYEDNKIYNNYFSSIVVKKDYQGCGIANKLLDALKQFVKSIEEKGYKCFIAPRDIVPGEDYNESLINAIEDCDIFYYFILKML